MTTFTSFYFLVVLVLYHFSPICVLNFTSCFRVILRFSKIFKLLRFSKIITFARAYSLKSFKLFSKKICSSRNNVALAGLRVCYYFLSVDRAWDRGGMEPLECFTVQKVHRYTGFASGYYVVLFRAKKFRSKKCKYNNKNGSTKSEQKCNNLTLA